MKWAVGLIVVVAGGAIAWAAFTMDAGGAAVFAFATLTVILLGAAPIVFSALTRRADERRRQPQPPTVIREDRPRRERARPHRGPRG